MPFGWSKDRKAEQQCQGSVSIGAGCLGGPPVLTSCCVVLGSSLNLSGCFICKTGMMVPKCWAGACWCWVLPKCWIQSIQTTVCTCPHTSKMRCQLEKPHVQSIFTSLQLALGHPARQTACRFAVYRSLTCPGPPGVMAEPQRRAGFRLQWNLLKLFTTHSFLQVNHLILPWKPHQDGIFSKSWVQSLQPREESVPEQIAVC